MTVNGEWQYSIPECMANYDEGYPELVFDYNALTNSLQLFRETGSVGRKIGSRGPI